MNPAEAVPFSDGSLHRKLESCSSEDLDGVDFAVVGIDVAGVEHPNDSFEFEAGGPSSRRVLGHPPVTVVFGAEVKCAHRSRRTKLGQMGKLNLTDKRGWPSISP